MANILLSALTEKNTLIFILSGLSVWSLFFAIRECVRSPRKENFYLLSARLIESARSCKTFDELDIVKGEFFITFKKYTRHENYSDCFGEVNGAIRTQAKKLHEKNFNNGGL